MKNQLCHANNEQKNNKTDACKRVAEFSRTSLSMLVAILMTQTALAENSSSELNEPPVQELDAIQVSAKAEKLATESTAEVKTSKDIRNNQIDTLQDLVRYNTDISIAEIGRYGNKGFAMRGVDGNRVALSLDGVSLPDRQVNEFFSRYGNMYEGRFSPDVEMLSEARIQVGADSFKSGSGAVGGSVNYRTKEPSDLVKPGEKIGGYAKLGYADRNEEFTKAVGLAVINDQLEGIINYVRRDGHELKNHEMVGFNSDKLNPEYNFRDDPDYPNTYPVESSLPDPLEYQSDAFLGKVYFHLNDEHRFGLQGVYQKRDSLSNNYSTRIYEYTEPPAKMGKDSTELRSFGVNYRYLPMASEFIDEIRADISRQEINATAHTDDYSKHWSTKQYEWTRSDIRPQRDTVHQVALEGKLLPIETEALGTHNISFDTKYSKLDHDLILQADTEYGGWDTFVGPAVKKNVFNIALSDSINVTDKLTTTIGLRYDSHDYKPYVTETQKAAILRPSSDTPAKQYLKNGDFEKKRSLDNFGGMLAFDYKLTPNWQVGYKFSTGFMAPSTSQMYSTFKMLGNVLALNPDLKPEKSENHEVSISANYDNFSASLTGFYTDYEDFIQYRNSYGKAIDGTDNNLIRAENINKAETYGARLGGTWDLSNLANTNGNIKLSGNVSYAEDKTDEGINLLTTEPFGAQLGLHYESANRDYQLNASARYLGAKKAEDAKVWAVSNRGSSTTEGIEPFEYIDSSVSAVVYDVYGSKKLGKGITLSAGVYNLFDEEYTPWSNLRSLADFGLNTAIGKNGEGIERYTAPGRNYKVGLTYEF